MTTSPPHRGAAHQPAISPDLPMPDGFNRGKTEFPHTLEGRNPWLRWAPAFAGVAKKCGRYRQLSVVCTGLTLTILGAEGGIRRLML